MVKSLKITKGLSISDIAKHMPILGLRDEFAKAGQAT
jgi:hypothetical protein